MQNFIRLFLLLSLLSTSLFAQSEKYMAVTFDDMPFAHHKMFVRTKQLKPMEKLISYIKDYNIPAVGLVNEGKLFDNDGKMDSAKLDILKMWLDAGLELGNHTYSHLDINKVPLEDYEADILKGELVTRPLAEERGIKYEYFRYPFLRSGETTETMLAVREFLKDHNYKNAPVTIDNSEWVFAYAYNLAYNDNDTTMMARLGKDYTSYMITKIKYWEDESQKLFGRNIKHVLLVHANLINSEYFDELAQAIQDYGYKFISLDEAVEDPAYQSENNYIGKYGPSWIYRWAKTKGIDTSFNDGEPKVPAYIMEYANLDFE